MNKPDALRRQELYNLLGELPDRNRPIAAKKIGEEDRDAYILEKLVLDLNGIEDAPAFFIRPREARGPLPAVLFNHAHGGDYVLGKRELLEGREGAPDAWRMSRYSTGHMETAAMRAEIVAFLKRWI